MNAYQALKKWACRLLDRFKPLLNAQNWLKPKTIGWLIVVALAALISSRITHWLDLNMDESFKSVGVSVEYGKIERLASEDFDKYSQRVNCDNFALNLDDNILTNYIVIPFQLRNYSRNPTGPVSFFFDAGCSDVKIVDVQYSIRSPKAKVITMRHDLPALQWSRPTNNVVAKLSYRPGLYSGRLNIYCSLDEDTGYGLVKSVNNQDGETQLLFAPNPEPDYWFFVSTGVNDSGEVGPSEVLKLPNQLYRQAGYKPLKESTTNQIQSSMSTVTDKLPFLRGLTTLVFDAGLDPKAVVDVYVLAKVPPGQSVSPSLKMDGAPNISFVSKNSSPLFSIPRTQAINRSKLESLPSYISAISLSDRIVIFCYTPQNPKYNRMIAFRSKERRIGDYSELGEKVFDGYGNTNSFTITTWYGSDDKVSTNAPPPQFLKYFERPPVDPQTNVVASMGVLGRRIPTAPRNLRVGWNREFKGMAHFVDTPPEEKVGYTYTLYFYDSNGSQSYPVIVNATIDSSAKNRTFELLP